MINIIRKMLICFLLLPVTKCGFAQVAGIYQTSNAVLLQVNGNEQIENRLTGAFIALSKNSSRLIVRLSIPTEISSPGLDFNLKVNINQWQVQDDLTSAKMYSTTGLLTLNSITKPVNLQYLPLPSGTDQEGDFNISIIIQINPIDFSMDEQDGNSQFIIKINDAKVNRM
jgi:hypothetical protein